MQEGERLGHFVHTIHAILDADPPRVARLVEQAENRRIVIDPLARHTVLQDCRVTRRPFGLRDILPAWHRELENDRWRAC